MDYARYVREGTSIAMASVLPVMPVVPHAPIVHSALPAPLATTMHPMPIWDFVLPVLPVVPPALPTQPAPHV